MCYLRCRLNIDETDVGRPSQTGFIRDHRKQFSHTSRKICCHNSSGSPPSVAIHSSRECSLSVHVPCHVVLASIFCLFLLISQAVGWSVSQSVGSLMDLLPCSERYSCKPRHHFRLESGIQSGTYASSFVSISAQLNLTTWLLNARPFRVAIGHRQLRGGHLQLFYICHSHPWVDTFCAVKLFSIVDHRFMWLWEITVLKLL